MIKKEQRRRGSSPMLSLSGSQRINLARASDLR